MINEIVDNISIGDAYVTAWIETVDVSDGIRFSERKMYLDTVENAKGFDPRPPLLSKVHTPRPSDEPNPVFVVTNHEGAEVSRHVDCDTAILAALDVARSSLPAVRARTQAWVDWEGRKKEMEATVRLARSHGVGALEKKNE